MDKAQLEITARDITTKYTHGVAPVRSSAVSATLSHPHREIIAALVVLNLCMLPVLAEEFVEDLMNLATA